jgi:mitochondrial import receptor subunit TOM40
MFRFGKLLKVPLLRGKFVTFCDGDENQEEDMPNLVEEADAAMARDRNKIRTPSFDELRGLLGSGSVGTYDGFRLIVQKQVNLNTVVSHFYWIGSQVTGQPIYQYRCILPYEDTVGSVATDMDFNVEGDFKTPVHKNVMGKFNFSIGDQKKALTAELEHKDASSTTQLQFTREEEDAVSLSHMQAITPCLSLGGMGTLSPYTMALTTTFGGIYDLGDHVLAAQWDQQVRFVYLRKVNLNRVHVSTDLTVSPEWEMLCTQAAEYTFKQSKLSMSIDSNLELKSTVETTVAPGVQMQFSAEMAHMKNQYRFGYGIIMG